MSDSASASTTRSRSSAGPRPASRSPRASGSSRDHDPPGREPCSVERGAPALVRLGHGRAKRVIRAGPRRRHLRQTRHRDDPGPLTLLRSRTAQPTESTDSGTQGTTAGTRQRRVRLGAIRVRRPGRTPPTTSAPASETRTEVNSQAGRAEMARMGRRLLVILASWSKGKTPAEGPHRGLSDTKIRPQVNGAPPPAVIGCGGGAPRSSGEPERSPHRRLANT